MVSILQDAAVRSSTESVRPATSGCPLHPKGWTPYGGRHRRRVALPCEAVTPGGVGRFFEGMGRFWGCLLQFRCVF